MIPKSKEISTIQAVSLMNRRDMENRLVAFAKRVIYLYGALKDTYVGCQIGGQLVRAATSVGANYAEATHGRSGAEFISKIKLCEGEAAEAHYWLTVIIESRIIPPVRLLPLRDEAYQIVSILHATAATAQRNLKQKNKP